MNSPVSEMLTEVGNMHASDILLLSIAIIGAGIMTYFILLSMNKKKPHEERRSNFALFLIALNVSFFLTVTIFVYKVLIIGIKYLLSSE
ncbi:hypothetical protein [Persephonella sp.]